MAVRPVLPDVYAEVRDGGLGLASGNLEGIHVKIGIASSGSVNTITYLASQRDAIAKFGTGPLVDGCVDSFSSGAQVVYAIRANASIPGSIGSTVGLWVQCVRAGECGVAQIRYSLDNGVTFGPKVTVPEDGKVKIESRNIEIHISPTATVPEPNPEYHEGGDNEGISPTIDVQKKSTLTGNDVWKFNVSTGTGMVTPTGVDITTSTATVTATAKPIAITKLGTGKGTLTVGGNPLVNAEVRVTINAGGGLNEATYQYSLDGGDTWSGTITVPEEETEIVGTGIMLTFEGSGFEAGDMWRFNAQAPQMSNGDLIEAMEMANAASVEYEFIHIVGECGRSTWAACQSMAETMFQNHRYTFFLCEGRKRTDKESVDEWVTSLSEEAGKFAGMRVVVVPVRLEMVDMNTGYQVDRNAGGVVAGLIAKTPVQRSIGSVMYNPVSLGLELNPYPQYGPAHIQALDASRYTTMRRYTGRAGIYVTNGYTMAESTSDYRELTYLRVMNKACRVVRNQLINYLHGEADETGQKYIQAAAEGALMNMQKARELDKYRIQIPGNQNVLSTQELVVEISIVPIGIIKWIKMAIGFENPAIRELIGSAA